MYVGGGVHGGGVEGWLRRGGESILAIFAMERGGRSRTGQTSELLENISRRGVPGSIETTPK